ncbi:MAG: rhodanese-like domain-containing protein [Actinomycetales bacterium]|nr:rhodanese-like domain-containing protein [Actinomycetales bacterium]
MTYAGDLTPGQTWYLLQDEPKTVLVDVRTAAELQYVGEPDLSALGRDTVRIEWLRYPGGALNDRFLDELAAAGVTPETPVVFLCKTGVRSVAAAEAATAAGYARAYNVLGGFEGPLDGSGHRGGVDGWKAGGMPWRQP